MSGSFVQSLPSRMLSEDEVSSLEDHEQIVQAVAVRGFFRDGPTAFQILLNIADRGLLGIHLNPDAPEDGWRIVFDSADIDMDEHDSDEMYRFAHEKLVSVSPDLEEEETSYFEKTLENEDVGMMEWENPAEADEEE